jgi:hypothetical protein
MLCYLADRRPRNEARHRSQAVRWAVGRSEAMTIRTRKLVGTIALLVFLGAYALVAMLVAVALQVNASKTVELAYYVIAGLLWVLPAALLI